MSAPAYRIAPRRAGSRPSRSRVDWERLGRIGLVLVLLVILALYINPVVNFVDAWTDARAENSQLADLKAENRELRGRAETLSHSDAAELGARRLGMVSPDERSVVICGPTGPVGCEESPN